MHDVRILCVSFTLSARQNSHKLFEDKAAWAPGHESLA